MKPLFLAATAQPRPTSRERTETLILQQAAARDALFAAIIDRDDLIVRMARLQLRDVDAAAVTCAQVKVAHAEVQYAKLNGVLLDAADDCDVILHDDMTDALTVRARRITAPIGDGDDSAQHLGRVEYGLSYQRRA